MVSICITTTEMGGNGVKMLETLLNSIVSQDYKDIEIIVSDDSTDHNIKAFCAAVPFVKYFHNGSRGKSSINMNNAISRATGELIKPMFQDDYFADSNALSKIVVAMTGNYWGVCRSSNHFPFHNTDTKKLAEGENTYGCPSVVVFRPTDIKFDENLVWLMDCEFYSRLQAKCGLPVLIDTVIQIVDWPGSITNTAGGDLRLRELEYVQKKYK